MIITDDIAALLLAIDGGDDDAILALADALEEQGDPLVPHLRWCFFEGRRPKADSGGWLWDAGAAARKERRANHISHADFLRLPDHLLRDRKFWHRRAYSWRRSDAFLALADARLSGAESRA